MSLIQDYHVLNVDEQHKKYVKFVVVQPFFVVKLIKYEYWELRVIMHFMIIAHLY